MIKTAKKSDSLFRVVAVQLKCSLKRFLMNREYEEMRLEGIIIYLVLRFTNLHYTVIFLIFSLP